MRISKPKVWIISFRTLCNILIPGGLTTMLEELTDAEYKLFMRLMKLTPENVCEWTPTFCRCEEH